MIGRFRFPVTSRSHLIELLLKARQYSKSDWIACCCCSNEFWKFPITPVVTCFSVECCHGAFLYYAKQNFTISSLVPINSCPFTWHLQEESGFVLLTTTYSPSTFCILFQFIVVEMAVHEQSYAHTIGVEILLHLCSQNKIFGCHINKNKGALFLGKGDT